MIRAISHYIRPSYKTRYNMLLFVGKILGVEFPSMLDVWEPMKYEYTFGYIFNRRYTQIKRPVMRMVRKAMPKSKQLAELESDMSLEEALDTAAKLYNKFSEMGQEFNFGSEYAAWWIYTNICMKSDESFSAWIEVRHQNDSLPMWITHSELFSIICFHSEIARTNFLEYHNAMYEELGNDEYFKTFSREKSIRSIDEDVDKFFTEKTGSKLLRNFSGTGDIYHYTFDEVIVDKSTFVAFRMTI